MSLYIRLQSSFWTHRKTLRLRATIGDAAFWIPPRLWSYAADNQPDGDFTDYSPEELALLIGYSGNAQAMLQALQQARFFDGMRIHDWGEHNGYHSTFSDRAKKAAAARWGKEKDRKKKRQERKGKETSIASGMLEASEPSAEEIYEAYPRKVARPEAIKAIEKAMSVRPAGELLRLTTAFAATQAKGDQFTPYPATWFNQQRFNDDPETWKPKNNGTHNSRPAESSRNLGTANAGHGRDYANYKVKKPASDTGV